MIAESDIDKQLRRGVVEACILGLLDDGNEMYGWEIAEVLIERGNIIASIGTLYPVLGRLRDRGLVTTFTAPSESGPSRRYYQITPQGRKMLKAFRKTWQKFTADVTAIIEEEKR